MDGGTEQPTPKSVRLIFEYEGDRVRLVNQIPVELAVTGFDTPQESKAGHFVDVRSANDDSLVRVAVREAMQTSAEVFPEKPGDPITRVDLPEPRGAFTVVVPLVPRADHVTLLRVPEAPAEGEALAIPAPVELGSFGLSVGEES